LEAIEGYYGTIWTIRSNGIEEDDSVIKLCQDEHTANDTTDMHDMIYLDGRITSKHWTITYLVKLFM
jgi:hypothetical protein